MRKLLTINEILKTHLILCVLLITSYTYVKAANIAENIIESPTKKISGRVLNDEGQPLPAATVSIEGSSRGVIADDNGAFTIDGVVPENKLIINYLGMETQVIQVGDNTVFDVYLSGKSNELEGLTVVAFSAQKKESVLASITTVNPSEMKVPSSNLTTALAGRVAGMISYQTSGEPGADNAQFFIRGITTFGAKAKADPLILIDGIELTAQDLARMNTDDIASFSIMKDAAATALYGARGANGVILVTTKQGREGAAKVSARLESSLSSPTYKIKLADPITYMKMHNEAITTRDPLGLPMYSFEKITMTERGLYPDRYPTVDWRNFMFKDYSYNHRANLSVSGGGGVARYYIAGSFSQDNGNLKMDKRNNFNSNVKYRSYTLRSNINLNLTKTTEMIVRLSGTFDNYTGPVYGGNDLYLKAMMSSPVLFKPFYEPDEAHENTNHILFGNYGNADYINPYAEMIRGYKDWTRAQMHAQLELKQNLDFITEGLKSRVLFNTNRLSQFDVSRYYNPYYYNIKTSEKVSDPYELVLLNEGLGTEYLNYNEGAKVVNSTTYLEAVIEYNRTVREKHNFGGLLVGILRDYRAANAGTLQASLPQRNLGLSGRITYNYDTRYFAEFNFGYNGSERFSKRKRFGFFPSVGVGWLISNEKFFAGAKKVVTQFKLKGTFGLVGNDAIGDVNDRFFYLSEINMNTGGVNFGENLNHHIPGISTVRYANDKIGWETSYKTNIGIEFSLFDKFTAIMDAFYDKRVNILLDRVVSASMGLSTSAPTQANLGAAVGRGFDIELNYQHVFSKNFWITERGTFTFAHSEVLSWEEPNYSDTPWMSRKGTSIHQIYGYVAERLFIDDEDVKNSPTQFGEYLPGDIKYRDINGDGKITTVDAVPIGHPTVPEIVYGFGFSLGYRQFDFSVFFQGSARQSLWLDTGLTVPFVDADQRDSYRGITAVMDAVAKNYWSKSNPNIYAQWPRLATYLVQNNRQWSTWQMQNAAFMRLKTAEIGYTIPRRITDKIRMDNLRVYVSGSNLLTFSAFKLWDPEMAGNGLGYPLQRVINLGLHVSF